jgi:hypothetical protein
MQDEARAAAELQQGGQRCARTSINRRKRNSNVRHGSRIVRLIRCDDRNNGGVNGFTKAAAHTPK